MRARSPGPSRLLQPREILIDPIEQAALLLHPVEALFRRAASAEQPLEHDTRVVLYRQGSRGRLPRDCIHVCAAVTRFALAAENQVDLRRNHFHRRQHSLLAELLRRNLIGRRSKPDVRAFGLLRVHAIQPRSRTRACARRCRRRATRPASERGRSRSSSDRDTARAERGSATARSSYRCLSASSS